MKKTLFLFLLLSMFFFQSNAQGVFDDAIHTAVGFGDVNFPGAEGPQQIIDDNPMTKFLDFNVIDGMGFEVDLLGVTSVLG